MSKQKTDDPKKLTRSEAAKWGAFQRKCEARYYIRFQLRGRKTGVWPVLFSTRALAEEAIQHLPVFHNAKGEHGIKLIRSCSVEKTRVRRRVST